MFTLISFLLKYKILRQISVTSKLIVNKVEL